ncbi:MAG: SDR family oxidoreductase, partial [Cyclobacteriaceae bacterium]
MSQKVAIVTGAGSGIGRSASLALLESGFTVVLAGRRLELLEQTAAQMSDPSRLLIVQTDVTDPASVQNLFLKAKDAFDRLDLLFNNAGINTGDVLLEDLDFTQWKA